VLLWRDVLYRDHERRSAVMRAVAGPAGGSGSVLAQRDAPQLSWQFAFLELMEFKDRESCGEAFYERRSKKWTMKPPFSNMPSP
jgi:hypothetical protein